MTRKSLKPAFTYKIHSYFESNDGVLQSSGIDDHPDYDLIWDEVEEVVYSRMIIVIRAIERKILWDGEADRY